MDWKKRGARIAASFVTGYSGGLSVTVPIYLSFEQLSGSLYGILAWPLMAGFVASLPQAGKILNEYAGMNADGN